jgi:hypothetical protein
VSTMPPAELGDTRVRFPCPLCAEDVGRSVLVTAEFDFGTDPVTVADFTGCEHAEAFGLLGRLTPDQERRLIAAALDAFEAARRPRPDGAP